MISTVERIFNKVETFYKINLVIVTSGCPSLLDMVGNIRDIYIYTCIAFSSNIHIFTNTFVRKSNHHYETVNEKKVGNVLETHIHRHGCKRLKQYHRNVTKRHYKPYCIYIFFCTRLTLFSKMFTAYSYPCSLYIIMTEMKLFRY